MTRFSFVRKLEGMKRIFGADKVRFSKLERTPEGFLKGELAIARTGVYEYRVDGRSVKKVKMPDDLFSEANIESLKGAPMTDGHPLDANGQPVEVDADNYKQYAKGNVSEPRVIGTKIKAQGIIYDRELADEVEAGDKIEMSAGFVFNEEERGGEYDGESYDAAQRNIVSNHVAVVKAGRAGPGCSFNVDIKEEGMPLKWRTRDEKEIAIDGDNASVIHGELTHYKGAADEAASELEKAEDLAGKAVDKIKQLTVDLAEAKKAPKPTGDEKEKVEQLEKDKKSLEDKLELAGDEKKKLEKDLKAATDAEPKVIQDRVARRVKLEADAKAFGIDDCAGMTDRQVMEQVIQGSDLAYAEGVKVGNKKDEAISDRFDSAVEMKRKDLNSDKGPDGGLSTAADDQEKIDKGKKGRANMHESGKKTEKGGKA